MRTTIDIDGPVLKQLKTLSRSEKKSLGRLASDLLANAMASRAKAKPDRFQWISKPMGARVDLADREAVLDALDQDPEA